MITRLILVRHAKPDYSFPEDPPLSSEGKEIHAKVSQSFKSQGFTPDEIYSSPLTRAQQTADIMGTLFNLETKIDKALLGFDFEGLVTRAANCKEGVTTLFVGHAPTLRELALRFTDIEVPLQINKSQIFILEFNGPINKENNISFRIG